MAVAHDHKGTADRGVTSRGTKDASAKQAAWPQEFVRPYPPYGAQESNVRRLATDLILHNGTRVQIRELELRYFGRRIGDRVVAISADRAPVMSRWLQFVSELGWFGQARDGTRRELDVAPAEGLLGLLLRDMRLVRDFEYPDLHGRFWRVDGKGRNSFYSSYGDHAPPEHGWGEIIYDEPTTTGTDVEGNFDAAGRPELLINQVMFDDYLYQQGSPVARLGWMLQESFRRHGPAASPLQRAATYLSVLQPTALPAGATLPSHLARARAAYDGWIVNRVLPSYYARRPERRVPEDRGLSTQTRTFGR